MKKMRLTYIHIVALSSVLVVLGHCKVTISSPMAIRSQFQTLLKDYEHWRLETSPQDSSMLGHHQFDAKLNPRSLSDFVSFHSQCQLFQNRAEGIRKKTFHNKILNDSQAHALNILIWETKFCQEGILMKGYLLGGVDKMQGPQISLPYFFKNPNFFDFKSMNDTESALMRLQMIPEKLEASIETMKEGARVGITCAKESMESIESQFNLLYIDDVELSAFYTPFKNLTEQFPNQTDSVSATQTKAKSLITSKVIPAFKKLQSFLVNEFSQNYRKSVGVYSLPNGHRYYQMCLKFHTSLDNITAEELYETGTKEIQIVQEQILELGTSLGLNGTTFQEILSEIDSSESQKFKRSDEMLSYAKEVLKNKIVSKVSPFAPIDLQLHELKVAPLQRGFKQTSTYAASTIYLNTNTLDTIKKYEIMAILLHHVGDHIVQINAKLSKPELALNLPSFGTPSIAPSGIPTYSAFNQGFSLYFESLGHDLGVYDEDKMALMGKFKQDLLRSSRLVLDPGIHDKGWSKDKAVDFLMSNSALTRSRASSEVERCITWPGQSVSYKVGARKFKELREESLGSIGLTHFSLKYFHSHLLSCKGPLDRIADCIKAKEAEVIATASSYLNALDSFLF